MWGARAWPSAEFTAPHGEAGISRQNHQMPQFIKGRAQINLRRCTWRNQKKVADARHPDLQLHSLRYKHTQFRIKWQEKKNHLVFPSAFITLWIFKCKIFMLLDWIVSGLHQSLLNMLNVEFQLLIKRQSKLLSQLSKIYIYSNSVKPGLEHPTVNTGSLKHSLWASITLFCVGIGIK